MLEHGFLRPSDSPYGAPILFLPEKNGSLRFCIDYRWLNKKMVKNGYPIPLLEELFDRLRSSKVFNKIDLRSEYWQMPVKPEDVHKTAFKTRWGLYEYLVMPFGVTNAPTQFMNMMNAFLGEYLDKFVLIFLDNVLIYSANPQDHAEHLQKILEKLREHKMYAKASKCEILKTSVEFLGQQICRGGMTPTEANLKAAQDWATLEDVKGVRSFLGFANYYTRFVSELCSNRGPLDIVDKEGCGIKVGALSTVCLSAIKRSLVRCTILLFPDPKLPHTIVTNASGIAAGGVLMQNQGDGL